MARKRIEAWGDLYKDDGKRWAEQFEVLRLPSRELVIVAVARLDVAIAQLLADRLQGEEKEIVNFLGLDEDGRAPAGTFGARIQLAYLTGLVGRPILADLRKLQKLRNLMAHRVNASLLHERAQAELQHLRDKVVLFASVIEVLMPRLRPALEKAAQRSSTNERSAAELVWFAAAAIENGLLNLRAVNRRIERLEIP